jgi:mRNA interferase RelE/StbE
MNRPAAGDWNIQLTRRAEKDLARLDPPIKRRILEALVELGHDPRSATGVRKLAGRPESRLRVGDWRVIFEVSFSRHTVFVIRVLPRGKAYDR